MFLPRKLKKPCWCCGEKEAKHKRHHPILDIEIELCDLHNSMFDIWESNHINPFTKEVTL